MQKRIISIMVAFLTVIGSAVPGYADNATVYNQFKNASLVELKSLFSSKFDLFDISTDGNSYSESQKSLIILDAYHRGFESFEELDENVTDAADKLMYKRNNPELLGLSGHSNVNLTFECPTETNSADVFEIEDKEFILLDEATGDDGEPIFFVMAKDYYGVVALDPDNLGRWDDSNYRLLPYKLTNSMAFGSYSGGNLPESILRHLDILHEWNVEPGSGDGFTSETTLVAPISVISATEYKEYGEKIGLDGLGSVSVPRYWTRTPVLNLGDCHFTVDATDKTKLSKNKEWGSQYLRPVFYLKSDFFRNEQLQNCGVNVTNYIKNLVDTVTVEGRGIVNERITGSYSYLSSGHNNDGVEYQWQKSVDGKIWLDIGEATGNSYTPNQDDVGYYIRLKIVPVADSDVYYLSAPLNIAVRPISTPVASDVRIECDTAAKPGEIMDVMYSFTDENRDICSDTDYCWESSSSNTSSTGTVIGTDRYYRLTNNEAGKYIRVGVTPKKQTNSSTGRITVSGDTVYSDWMKVEDLPIPSSVDAELQMGMNVRLNIINTVEGLTLTTLFTPTESSMIDMLSASYTVQKSSSYDIVCEWVGSTERDGNYSRISSGTDVLRYAPRQAMWVKAAVYTKNSSYKGRTVYSDPVFIGEVTEENRGEYTLSQNIEAGKTYELWINNSDSESSYAYSLNISGASVELDSDKYITTTVPTADGVHITGTLLSDAYGYDGSFKAGEITLQSDADLIFSDAKTIAVGSNGEMIPAQTAKIFIIEKQGTDIVR